MCSAPGGGSGSCGARPLEEKVSIYAQVPTFHAPTCRDGMGPTGEGPENRLQSVYNSAGDPRAMGDRGGIEWVGGSTHLDSIGRSVNPPAAVLTAGDSPPIESRCHVAVWQRRPKPLPPLHVHRIGYPRRGARAQPRVVGIVDRGQSSASSGGAIHLRRLGVCSCAAVCSRSCIPEYRRGCHVCSGV